jgi:hypothetical protein
VGVGYLAGVTGVAVWIASAFPSTASEATHVGEAVSALALTALVGDLAAIALGVASLTVRAEGPSRRGLAIVALALGLVGLVGVLIVAWLGFESLQCGRQFDACRDGWTRT